MFFFLTSDHEIQTCDGGDGQGSKGGLVLVDRTSALLLRLEEPKPESLERSNSGLVRLPDSNLKPGSCMQGED